MSPSRPAPTPARLQDRRAAARSAARAERRRRQAQRRRRPGLSALLRRLLLGLLCSLGTLVTVQAQVAPGTLPTGANVVSGQAQIQALPHHLVVQQGSARLGLDWTSFSIGSAATVEFRQPGRDAVALNRVLGADPSQIYGRLQANGQVFLSNPNGVLFAPGAQVDVGALVATTLDLSQQDFAEGRLRFAGPSARAVRNEGRIAAAEGGYVALFGREVHNGGEISVPAGRVLLASGSAATVSIAGHGLLSAVVAPGAPGAVVNAGQIAADGGRVQLSAQSATGLAASLVNNSGVVRARAIVQRGGEIWITGDEVASSGRLDADGTAGADGGRVVVRGGMDSGRLDLAGTISARAGAGGAGGEVETSAAFVAIAPATRVDTRAADGRHGSWTIDPTDFTVGPGSDAQSASGIGAATLEANLALGHVELATAPQGDEPGDIHVNAPVSWSADTRLTLTAARHINLNASLTATGDAAGLVLTPGSGGNYFLASGAQVTLSGSAPTLQIAGTNYTVVNTLAALQAIGTDNTTLRANWALGSDIDASATAGWNSGAGFVPLGNAQSAANYFGGRLEGFNHRISNLVVRRPEESYVGFIGYAAASASVRHLELTGVDVVGGLYTGGLIGYGNTGTSVQGVRVGGQVVALTPTGSSAYVGLVAGLYYGTAITASSSSGSVYSDSRHAYAGGLVGYMLYGGISGSSSSASVSAVDEGSQNGRAGGLVGGFYGTSISDSSASGAVRGTYYAGGLVGEFGGSGSIVNSSASGAVSDARSYAGGLVGYFYGNGGVATSFASGSVVSVGNSGHAGGLVGYYAGNGHVSDSAATGAVSSGYVAGGLIGEMYGYTNSRIQNSRASGDVTSSGYAAGGLVGQFYDYYSSTGSGIAGSHATGRVHGNNYSGGLVGYYLGYDGITGSHATGAVTGGQTNTTLYIGGLVGYFYNYNSAGGGVVQSYAGGDVRLNDAALTSGRNVYAGGLVGYLDGGTVGQAGIVDSHASGSVSVTSPLAQARAGGLVGYADVGVTRGLSTGAVVANSDSAARTGGLIGERRAAAPVVDSYWDLARSGQALSNGGTGLDATAVRQGASYTGWDLGASAGQVTLWRIYEGHAAPMLRGLLTPQTVALADLAKTYDGTASFGDAPLLNTSNQPLSRPELVQVALAAVDAGSYGITAAQVYSAPLGYDLDVTGSATLTINPRPLTLAGVVADKVYDGTRDATLVPGAQPAGLVPGEDLLVDTAAVSAAFDTRDAGSGKVVTLSGYALADGTNGKAANYSLASSTTTSASITPKPLDAVTLSATPRAYDGTTAVAVGVVPAGTIPGIVGSDQVALSVVNAAGALADKHAGTGKPVTVSGVTLSGPDAGNYAIAGLADLRVDIAPKAVTVNGLAATNRMYNGSVNVSVATGGATVGGFVAGDTVQLVDQTLTGQMADKHVGSAKPVSVTTLTLRGPDAANYAPVAGAVNVDIAPRTVTVYAYSASGQANKVYDGSTAASATVYPDYNYDGNDLVVGSTSITYADKHVGSNKTITVAGLSLSGSAAANYTLVNASATLTGNITPRPLTVAGVSAVNRVYDGTVNVEVNVGSATVDTANVVPGDDVTPQIPSSGVVTGTMANKNVGTAKPVTVPGFSLTGADAGNYTLTGSNGVTVDIARKPLTAVYTGVDKVYDGNAYAVVSSTSADIVAGDQVLFYISPSNGYTGYAQFANTASSGNNAKDVGTGKPIDITYNYLYGSDAGNYTLTNTTGTTSASITPKGITPVFGGVAKVYDGTAAATVTLNRSASGIVGNDDVGLSLVSVFTGANAEDVGSNKPIAISDVAFSGPAAGNYTLSTTTASASADITPKVVGLTGVAATNRAYDGTTVVALTATGTLGIDGLVGGDVVSVVEPPSGLGDGTIADKRVGTAKPVTVTGLTLAGADAGNYTLDGSSGVTVDITPRPLTAVYTGVDRVYNGGVTALVTASSPDIVTVSGVTDQVTFAQSANFTGDGARNAGTNKPIAVSGITIAGADAANYALQNTTASTTASITPRPLSVGYTGIDRVYNGLADLSASVTGSSAQLVAGDTVVFSQTARFVGDGAAGTGKSIEVTGITLGGTHAGNYSLTATSAFTTATITPRPLDVTGIAATDRVYDGSTVVSVSVNSADVDLSGRIGNDEVAVVLPSSGLTSGTMADKNVGSNKLVQVTGLTLTGAQAANYRLSGGGITVDITPKPVTAVYAGQDKVYDGSVVAQVGGSSADFEAVDAGTVGISALGAFTGSGAKNVGTAKPVAVSGGFLTGVDRDNYTLLNPEGSTTAAITPRTLTASYSGGSKVYDGGVDAPVTGGAAGLVTGDQVGFTQTAVFTGAGAKNVGNNKPVAVSGIALTGADAGNYVLASTDAATTARITPRPLDIEGLNAVRAVDRVYDGTLGVVLLVDASGPLVPSSDDIVAGDDVTITLPPSGITSGTMADRHAGTGKAVVVDGLGLGGTDAGNYLIAATSGVRVDIAPKPLTASFAGVSRPYDGSAAAAVTGSSADIVAGDAVAIAGSGVFTGPGAKNVGTGKPISVLDATLTGSDRGNYSLVNRSGDTSADITPRIVTAVYTGGTRVYDGGIVAPVSGTAAGFVAGDSVSLAASAFFTDGKQVGSDKPVQVAGITLAGADAANYSLAATDATTTASVTPRPLAVLGLTGVSATNRVYDGGTQVEVIVSSTGPVAPDPADLVPGDDVTVIAPPTGVTTGTMADKHVGTAKPVAVAGLGLAGLDAGNYSVALTSGVTVDIAPRPLTAVWTGVGRVYDGTDLASVTGSSADLLAGDLLAISGSGVFSGGKGVGTGKAVVVTGGQLAGADAANYSLANPTGSASADITPRPLTASYTGGTRVYDGTLAAPVSAGSADLIAGDVVAFAQTALFTDKHVGSDKPVQVSGITLAGTDAANYQLTSTSAAATASIVPRPVTIVGLDNVVATSRVYDGTTTVAVRVDANGPVGAAPGDLIAGDDVQFQAPASGQTTGTMADKHAGTGKAVVVAGLGLSGTDAGNYRIAATQGVTVDIAPRPLTATWTGVSRVYDGTDAAQVLGSSADLIAGDTLSFAAIGSFSGGKHVGTGKAIVVSGGQLGDADAGNYTLLNPTGSASADITPRALTALASGGSRVYDGSTDAPVTLSAADLIAGDLVGFTQSARFSDGKQVGSDKPVEVSAIALTGADAANYALTATTLLTTASVTPRPLSVTGLTGVSAVDRTYDGTTLVDIVASGPITAAGADVIAGDDVSVQLPPSGPTAGTMADKHAGTGKAVVLSGLTLAGTDAGNYVIAGTAGVTVDIAPRPVTLSGLAALPRVYDGSTAVAIDSSAGSLAGALAGDDVALRASGVSGRLADKQAGNGRAVAVDGLALQGSDAGNYAVADSGGLRVDIARRPLALNLVAADKTYDGDTGATITLTDDRIAGDALSVNHAPATFDNRNAGAARVVSVTSLALAGPDAANYALAATQLTTTATIAPAPLTVAAGSLVKFYGDELVFGPGGYSASGLVAGETLGAVTLASAGAAAAAPVAGSPYALTVADARGGSFDPANYLTTYVAGTLTVQPRPLTIAANSVVRYADEANPADIGWSVAAGALVGGDRVGGVQVALPAGSAGAPGGSVLTMQPSGAVFTSGDAGNYELRYAAGLLVVLPKPPRIDEADPSAPSGDPRFAVLVDEAALRRALAALERESAASASSVEPGTAAEPPAAAADVPVTVAAPAGDAAPPPELAALLSGDGQRLSLPVLLRLPLISYDPLLRRLIFGADAAAARSPN
ncbi:MAG: filamentous hemagglutinin N-terminal domain-containing protein [Rubrivivax sp.]|nr:filamentous hemagglutinin N-terminal domain-containing protein [Rubrivivax sp.]